MSDPHFHAENPKPWDIGYAANLLSIQVMRPAVLRPAVLRPVMLRPAVLRPAVLRP